MPSKGGVGYHVPIRSLTLGEVTRVFMPLQLINDRPEKVPPEEDLVSTRDSTSCNKRGGIGVSELLDTF